MRVFAMRVSLSRGSESRIFGWGLTEVAASKMEDA